MSRLEDALEPRTEQEEKVARIIYGATSPPSILVEWEQAPKDDRRAALDAARKIIAYLEE